MNYLNILYQPNDHDALFTFLRNAFEENVEDVNVEPIVSDSYVKIVWDGLLEPNQVAGQLTEAVPSVLIECESNTGIDMYSRYFNKCQLW